MQKLASHMQYIEISKRAQIMIEFTLSQKIQAQRVEP